MQSKPQREAGSLTTPSADPTAMRAWVGSMARAVSGEADRMLDWKRRTPSCADNTGPTPA
eukprot:scaffold272518_cov17-Prasinocladus_malaysianus.AAC.1